MQMQRYRLVRTGVYWLCGLWSLLCSQLYGAEAWQSPEYIQQSFEEIALKNEFGAGDGLVHKWEQPIRVWIEHHADQQQTHDTLTRMHLAHLEKISGRPILYADSPESANLTIVFSKLQLWRNDIVLQSGNLRAKPAGNSICIFGIHLDPKKAIKRGWVVIPVDLAEEHRHLLACIVEELTQVMGLPNDSVKVFPSIFNDNSRDTLLTGLDGLLLRLLYHPRIKSGMKQSQLRPIVADILQQWQRDGTIEQAEQTVRQSELYEWMGF